MTLAKLPIKPFDIGTNRSGKIDRFFKSRKRFKTNGFIEILYEIKLVGGTKKSEYGYSGDLFIGSDAEFNQGLEDAYKNLIAKVMTREGYLYDATDDIQSIEDSEVEESKFLGYLIYYPNFKDEKTIKVPRKRKDGSVSYSIRFTKNGKFVKGGGLEYVENNKGKIEYVGNDEEKVLSYLERREESYSKTREQAKRRAKILKASEPFK